MEINIQNEQPSGVFRRAEKFEIDEHPFREISIDGNRVIAHGKSWESFEVLISFIGAAWMEKWRKYGIKVLGAGIFLIVLSFFTIVLGPLGIITMFLLIPVGILVIAVWALAKREALRIYTPAAVFKIEGASDFVEAVWKAITNAQRARSM